MDEGGSWGWQVGLRVAAIVLIIPGVALIAEITDPSFGLLAGAPFIAAALWVFGRSPDQRPNLGPQPRPLLRSAKGSHFPYRSPWMRPRPLRAASNRPVEFVARGRRAKAITQATILLFVAAIGWWGAHNSRASGELTALQVVAAVAFSAGLGWGARAIVKAVLSSRAVVVDRDHIRLGFAAGYLPPVSLRLDDLRGVAHGVSTTWLIHRDGRLYGVEDRQLADPGALLRILAQPEVADSARPDDGQTAPGRSMRPGRPSGVETEPMAEWHIAPPPPPEPFTDAMVQAVRQQRAVRFRVVAGALAVGCAALVVSGWWWIDQRSANDALAANGRLVRATVVDVTSGRSSSLTVEFEGNGRTLRRTIHPQWLSSFDNDNRGRTIGILFDPNNPDLVRVPDHRNMHPLTWVAVLSSSLVALAALRRLRKLRVWRRLIEEEWKPGLVSVRSAAAGQNRSMTITKTDGTKLVSRHVLGDRPGEMNDRPCNYVTDGRLALVVVTGRSRAAELSLRRW